MSRRTMLDERREERREEARREEARREESLMRLAEERVRGSYTDLRKSPNDDKRLRDPVHFVLGGDK